MCGVKGLLTSYCSALYHLPSHRGGVFWQMEVIMRRGGDFLMTVHVHRVYLYL